MEGVTERKVIFSHYHDEDNVLIVFQEGDIKKWGGKFTLDEEPTRGRLTRLISGPPIDIGRYFPGFSGKARPITATETRPIIVEFRGIGQLRMGDDEVVEGEQG